MSDNKGVMVHCEVVEGKLAAIATELLGCGRKLADELGEELSAVLAGSEVSGLAQEAIAFGADKVYVVDDALLKEYEKLNTAASLGWRVMFCVPRDLCMDNTVQFIKQALEVTR